jgi:hypothetical protein
MSGSFARGGTQELDYRGDVGEHSNVATRTRCTLAQLLVELTADASVWQRSAARAMLPISATATTCSRSRKSNRKTGR